MADKLNYMKSRTARFKDLITPARSYKQPKFTDTYLKNGPQFKHTWGQMAHMHDLRMWVMAYAPSTGNNLRYMQELHLLN